MKLLDPMEKLKITHNTVSLNQKISHPCQKKYESKSAGQKTTCELLSLDYTAQVQIFIIRSDNWFS